MDLRFLEDVELNKKEILGSYTVPKEELISFAKRWDYQPIHVDEEAAKLYPFGGIIAPTAYTISMVVMLYNQSNPKLAALKVLGYDEVRFPSPVRPGDTITVHAECIEKRNSNSKPGIGVTWYALDARNQDGESVLTYRVGCLVAKRPR